MEKMVGRKAYFFKYRQRGTPIRVPCTVVGIVPSEECGWKFVCKNRKGTEGFCNPILLVFHDWVESPD
jgi:hypothetical protein